jgi:hypothetical protein
VTAPPRLAATPVHPHTRALFVLGVCLTAGTGSALFALPGRTGEYWAWEIAAPLSAAFMGAGYVGASVSLAFAACTREWQRARVVVVTALTLTSLALVATLLNLGPFAFGVGGVTEAVAWVWLAVYVVLPPLALVAFVRQERAGGVREYGTEAPALGATRLALGAPGAALAALGLGLLADWDWLRERWPWPLPPLPAAAIGAWLCTLAAGMLWFALGERDWRRVRIGVLPATVVLGLDLAAAARFRDDFDSAAARGVYLAVLGALLATITVAAVVEERRLGR